MMIHRFKCSSELNDKIMEFSDIHKFDDKDTLIQKFTEWIETKEMMDILEKESNFLRRFDYDTPINVKIFKSIKYYYIKKFLKPEPKKEVHERVVQRLPKELKESIQKDLEEHFQKEPGFRPSVTFKDFDYDKKIPESTVKKCYNNQYYQIKHKKYDATVNA
jgi:hypothetical protein